MGAVTSARAVGTVTMLFTDIERSTVLLRELGSRWGEALNAHRGIIRAAVTETGGEEMGTEGDSFFVVFGSAPERAARLAGCADARRCALTMRRTPEDDQQLGRFLEPAQVALGASEFAVLRHEGGALSVSEALELVTSLRVVAAGLAVVM
jgi:class 3 adenylate cyclase